MELVIFNHFKSIFNSKITFRSDRISSKRLSFMTDSFTPDKSNIAPYWGTGGVTDLSVYGANVGGNYPGYLDMSMYIESLSVNELAVKAPTTTIEQHEDNPTNVAWAVIYDNYSQYNRYCLAFIDLGGKMDLTKTSLDLVWGEGSGILFTFSG